MCNIFSFFTLAFIQSINLSILGLIELIRNTAKTPQKNANATHILPFILNVEARKQIKSLERMARPLIRDIEPEETEEDEE